MSENRVKISLVSNLIIAGLTIFSTIILFTGVKFMFGPEPVLETTKVGMFKFFTLQSNIFIGIVSLIFAYEEIKLLNGKISEIGPKFYILKLMATTSVGITFFVVFTYLGPISKDGIASMLMNSNLFYHLIIPVSSIINFVLFEKTDIIRYKYTYCGIVPVFLYGIYYVTNIIIHMENGKVSTKYDWYWFVQNGVWTLLFVIPIMFLISYLISFALWKLNKKNTKKKEN